MKKVNVAKSVKLIAEKNFSGEKKCLDYYIVDGNRKIYAFTKSYANNVYDLCKMGIRVNELVTMKVKDVKIMKLVTYLKVIMPYLCEEYDISSCDNKKVLLA